jgi:hypothetical protein
MYVPDVRPFGHLLVTQTLILTFLVSRRIGLAVNFKGL